ncbi:MAG: molecular chaperone DnaJ, partial [Spirochaetales bacterium]|nr:molecular chaperone DnaJ [Spirochaetales bacterium]
LEGETIKVTIPAGIQDGKIIRVRNQGLPRYRNAESKGDMYIKVQIETPKRLGMKAKQIMKELSEAMGENDTPTPVQFENN